MGAQLNIKDRETVELVRRHAAETGRSVTVTVREAIERDRQARKEIVDDKRRQIDEIVAEFQRHMPDEWRGKTSEEIMDAIYDDDQPDGFAL